MCVLDRQRGVCVPSDERNTQETRRLHVVRRGRVRMMTVSLCICIYLSICLWAPLPRRPGRSD